MASVPSVPRSVPRNPSGCVLGLTCAATPPLYSVHPRHSVILRLEIEFSARPPSRKCLLAALSIDQSYQPSDNLLYIVVSDTAKLLYHHHTSEPLDNSPPDSSHEADVDNSLFAQSNHPTLSKSNFPRCPSNRGVRSFADEPWQSLRPLSNAASALLLQLSYRDGNSKVPVVSATVPLPSP